MVDDYAGCVVVGYYTQPGMTAAAWTLAVEAKLHAMKLPYTLDSNSGGGSSSQLAVGCIIYVAWELGPALALGKETFFKRSPKRRPRTGALAALALANALDFRIKADPDAPKEPVLEKKAVRTKKRDVPKIPDGAAAAAAAGAGDGEG